MTFLAYVDGEPIAAGDMVLLPFAGFLSGATTLPDYRGRGAFRALVRARWDEAVRRGTPALTVGAGKMSRPILERIGFTRSRSSTCSSTAAASAPERAAETPWCGYAVVRAGELAARAVAPERDPAPSR